jgi:Ubiquitin C-terminal hydrolase
MKAQYNGSDQHDSQEFLSFLLDGIHEDLNRILSKPVWAPTPEQEAELERLPQQIASDQEWRSWRTRNDSLIVDFFQGQFRNRLECLTCHQVSYNSPILRAHPHLYLLRLPQRTTYFLFFNYPFLMGEMGKFPSKGV